MRLSHAACAVLLAAFFLAGAAQAGCNEVPSCVVGGPCTACVPDAGCPAPGMGCCSGTGIDDGAGGCFCDISGGCGAPAVCGNGVCDAGENESSCCADCGTACDAGLPGVAGPTDACNAGCQGKSCFCNNAGCSSAFVFCGNAAHAHP